MTKPLPNGTVIKTMLAGHCVKAEIVSYKEYNETSGHKYNCKLILHPAAPKLCLDFNSQEFVTNGYEFETADMNIKRAEYWEMQGYV